MDVELHSMFLKKDLYYPEMINMSSLAFQWTLDQSAEIGNLVFSLD